MRLRDPGATLGAAAGAGLHGNCRETNSEKNEDRGLRNDGRFGGGSRTRRKEKGGCDRHQTRHQQHEFHHGRLHRFSVLPGRFSVGEAPIFTRTREKPSRSAFTFLSGVFAETRWG